LPRGRPDKEYRIMMRSRILPLALLALLAPAGAVRAQVAVGSPALSGWTSSSPWSRRPGVPVSAYSPSPYYPASYGSLAEPIFMTTLNTPGIYGAYSFGTGGITLTREPMFYPVVDDRETIPALDITSAPVRYLGSRTPAGLVTLTTGTTPPAPLDNGAASRMVTARVVVRVPEDARLEFEGVSMPQVGRIRQFVTPELLPGRTYRYDVRATWKEDGRDVVIQRSIRVSAGDRAEIDFLSSYEDNRDRQLHTKSVLPAPTPAGHSLRSVAP
jgi:uncharacterized protein (TIGR03000 family)